MIYHSIIPEPLTQEEEENKWDKPFLTICNIRAFDRACEHWIFSDEILTERQIHLELNKICNTHVLQKVIRTESRILNKKEFKPSVISKNNANH